MKKTTSWAAIIVGLVFFLPVGIYLLAKKVTEEKDSYQQNGKALTILALVLFCMIPIYFIFAFTGELRYEDGTPAYGAAFMMAIILGVGGIFSLTKGNQYIQRGQKYDQYISQLSPQHPVELRELASELKLPINTVISDLQCMIDTGYIPNAYIDHIRMRLAPKPVRHFTTQVICSACGGTNQVEPGKSAACEYCNTAL